MSELPRSPASPDPTEPAEPDLEGVLSRPAIRERDGVPRWVMRAQGVVLDVLTYDRRQSLAMVIVLFAIVIAFVVASTQLFDVLLGDLATLALVGLFLINWIGNGGILVPVPGTRFIGLLMIFQHTVFLPSWQVLLVGGTAMGLGLVSYYIAGARSADAYVHGDPEEAQRVVADSTILADPDPDPDPDPEEASQAAPVAVAGPPVGLQDVRASEDTSRRGRLSRRFSSSWQRARDKAQPTIEKHGLQGMFWLCFVPSPAATAAAFLGGALRFGFARFLLAAFASKFLLAAILVVAAFFFSDQAQSVVVPTL